MCGLAGFSYYGTETIKGLPDLTNSLLEQSAVRGTDATGIAYCSGGNIQILKESKAACKINFKHSDEITALVGHTRHSTQGSEKRGFNNHPFYGKTKSARFALAHNGVLTNDTSLKKQYKLPKTKIETDSYVAVQLLEYKKKLDFESIKFMAEAVDGSFSFSILDDKNNIWLVKGDSPLSILHFPKLKMYVYASTDEILYKALVDFQLLFKELKKGDFEEIKIAEGDILKICSDGKLERSIFEYSCYYGSGWWDYGFNGKSNKHDGNEYIDDLKSVASYLGYSPETIDELLDAGYTPFEIEDYIYCMEGEV